jgi:hypothetical protein
MIYPGRGASLVGHGARRRYVLPFDMVRRMDVQPSITFCCLASVSRICCDHGAASATIPPVLGKLDKEKFGTSVVSFKAARASRSRKRLLETLNCYVKIIANGGPDCYADR